MNGLVDRLEKMNRHTMIVVTVGGMLLVALLDYVSNIGIRFSLVYALPVAAAAWFVGLRHAMVLSALSVLFWIAGDMAGAGRLNNNPLVTVANGSVRLVSYVAIAFLLVRLRDLQISLESRVRERTSALTNEIREKHRLENDLRKASDHEQQRLGADLHDGLCQHLTGTALAGEVLVERLAARAASETENARRIVDLVEDAIVLSRDLAKGLNPVDMEDDGLMIALERFASNTSDLFKVSCTFDCEYPVLIHDPGAAVQIYRIAQEAVGNAIKHGEAKKVVITLDVTDDGARLRVCDNGIGLPDPISPNGGMGLRIMAHRANVIGAVFDIRRGPKGGTIVSCALPASAMTEEAAHV